MADENPPTNRKYTRTIDYLEEIVGADVARNLLRVGIVGNIGNDLPINISSQDLGEVNTNLATVASEPQSAVDVADQIDKIQNILSGQTLTVTDDGDFTVVDSGGNVIEEPLDVSDAVVTVTDNGSLSVSNVVSIQEDTPIDVSASEVDVDLSSQTASPLTVTDDGNLAIAAWNAGALTVSQDSAIDIANDIGRSLGRVRIYDSDIVTATSTTAGSSNAAQIDLGRSRREADIFYDVSGAATISIEVSTDGSTWRTLQTASPGSAGTDILQVSTSFRYVRAYADQNLNTIEMSSKGI